MTQAPLTWSQELHQSTHTCRGRLYLLCICGKYLCGKRQIRNTLIRRNLALTVSLNDYKVYLSRFADFLLFVFVIAVSGPTEHCPIFHFPSVLRSFVLRHRRDILTFLDILTVYIMTTIYFLNAYHPGWWSWPK